MSIPWKIPNNCIIFEFFNVKVKMQEWYLIYKINLFFYEMIADTIIFM